MEEILELLQYEFFTNALIAALLTSITCGIVGSIIVVRRMSFISGGITHASFGGIGLGYLLNFNPVIGAAIFGIIAGNITEFLKGYRKVREDSAIAMIWSVGMALGILFIYLKPGYAPDLNSYLFGDILTISRGDLLAMALVAILSITMLLFCYRLILYISFNEEFALTGSAPVRLINHLLISITALTIVVNIRVSGIILVMSLLTIPQTTAMLFTKNLKQIIVLSIGVAFLGIVIGLAVSYLYNIPSGATIILSTTGIYILGTVVKEIVVRRRVKRTIEETK